MLEDLNQIQWEHLMLPVIKSHKENVLRDLFDRTQWPPADDMFRVLSLVSASDKTAYLGKSDTSDRSVKERESGDHSEEFWSAVVDQYQINIEQFVTLGPSVFHWLFASDRHQPLVKMLEHSTQDQIKSFLLKKTDFVSTSSAFDKAVMFGAVVLTGSFDVIEALNNKFPAWTTLLDKKDRNALFFARSAKMVSTLLKSGVSATVLNKDGQSATDFWTAHWISNPHLQSWVEEVNRTLLSPQQVLENNVVFKVWTGQFNEMNEEEKSCLTNISSNAQWQWEGDAGGVKRSWSLPELYEFGRLMISLRVAKVPASLKNHFDYQINHHNGSMHLCAPAPLRSMFAEMDTQIPGAVLDSIISKDRSKSLMEQILRAFMTVSKTPGELIDVTKKTELYSGYGRHEHRVSDNVELNNKCGNQFLDSLSVAQATSLCSTIAPLIETGWFKDRLSDFGKMLSFRLAKPVSCGGLATHDWYEMISKSRQGEGLRDPTFAGSWITGLGTIMKADPQAVGNSSEWKPVLGIGLSLLGQPDVHPRNGFSKEDAEDALCSMINAGIEVEKIPVRWAKNYQKPLRAAVDGWIIHKELNERKTIKKKLEEAPPVKKRRM